MTGASMIERNAVASPTSRAGLLAMAMALLAVAMAPAAAQEPCGEVVTLKTHGGATQAYSLALPPASAPQEGRAALVLLPGAGGYVALDAMGCATRLKGNVLVRSLGHFHAAGFATALVDAPTGHRGEDGLGDFRLAEGHAEDIGKVIVNVRQRTGLPVWLVGSSRGAISAASAASRLNGPSAPDGLVLSSPVTAGRVGGRKAWTAQTVLSVRLEAIRTPVLVVVHAADACIRSPPGLASRIAARTKADREQTVTVTGGIGKGGASLAACSGRSHHGFLDQEAEVVAGIAKFIRGGRY